MIMPGKVEGGKKTMYYVQGQDQNTSASFIENISALCIFLSHLSPMLAIPMFIYVLFIYFIFHISKPPSPPKRPNLDIVISYVT